MVTTLWTAPEKIPVAQVEPGWEGIWTLAAGRAAVNLGLAVPLGVAAELTYAAMDSKGAG